jgi:hypothetical protein
MVYLGVRIRVMDNSLLLMNPMSIRPIRRRMSGTMRDASSLLVVGLVPGIALLLTCVFVTILFRRATIGCRLRHRGRGARHGCVVRGTDVIAIGVVFLVVRLFFRDQGAAAAKGTELFGVMVGFSVAVALEEGFLAGARCVVVGGGGAVLALFLVVAVQQDGHDGSEEEEEAENWSIERHSQKREGGLTLQ